MGGGDSKPEVRTVVEKVYVPTPVWTPPPRPRTPPRPKTPPVVYVPRPKTPPPPDQILPEPWTNVNIKWKTGDDDDGDRDKLFKKILDYKPSIDMKRLKGRIIFMGPVGSGKSSYFNTLNSIVKGEVTNKAAQGTGEKSMTRKFQDYVIKVDQGPRLKFSLCDTMGFEGEGGLSINNIGKILDGHIKDKYEFTEDEISKEDESYIQDPDLKKKTHCIALVLSGSNFPALVKDKQIMRKLRKIREEANKRDIPMAVIMTMVDILSARARDDAACVYSSKEVFDKVKLIEKELGVPRSYILPVKNYCEEASLKTNVDILALYTCSRLLRFVNDYLEDLGDSEEEDEDD